MIMGQKLTEEKLHFYGNAVVSLGYVGLVSCGIYYGYKNYSDHFFYGYGKKIIGNTISFLCGFTFGYFLFNYDKIKVFYKKHSFF